MEKKERKRKNKRKMNENEYSEERIEKENTLHHSIQQDLGYCIHEAKSTLCNIFKN
jgi:hypothetical protein